MKRLVGSDGYARARLANAVAFVALGAIVLVRTVAVAGITTAALPGCVLGIAMVGLGAMRFAERRAPKRRG